MKIFHISSSYWPAFEFGGPIESVHQLNKWLAKKGVDVTVYTTNAGLRKNKDIVLKRETIIDGVKVFYFPYCDYVHWTFSPALFSAIGKNIKDFDLIHITGIWNFPVMAAAFWARFYKKPYIISPRGSLMKEPLRKKSLLKKKIYLSLIAKRDLKNAFAIHFTTEAEKEEYLKAGLPMKKAVVIPNGLDMENYENTKIYESTKKRNFRKEFNISKDRKIVLFLSRLSWKKGLDTLIPAFAEVLKHESMKAGKQDAALILAGSDDENYKKEIEKQIANCKLQIDKEVIFTDMLLGDDKAAAYQVSDVFVLPSYSENFGQVVVEAMSFGLPVIITKNVGVAPSVAKAGAGLVVKKDVPQVSEAILKVLNNPDLAKKMAEAGRKLIETEFSWTEIVGKFVKEYRSLIRIQN